MTQASPSPVKGEGLPGFEGALLARLAVTAASAYQTQDAETNAAEDPAGCGNSASIDPETARANSLERYRLLGDLRPFSLPRTASCRRKRVSHTVQIQRRADGGYQLAGCETCGSVWGCPCCASKIYAGRALEVQQCLRLWQHEPKHYGAMLTLTVAHEYGDALKRIRKGLSHAWRLMWQGKAAKELRDRLGIAHYVRAVEVTHGQNGWHPHLHVLLFTTRKLDEWHQDELAERWQGCVIRALGIAARPDKVHGCNLTHEFRDDYIAKLGLEITDIENKRGKRGSKTPWTLAHEAADGSTPARHLWETYVHEMKGARQLTWSRGTKRHFGLIDVTDDELSSDGVPVTEGVAGVLGEWSGVDWDTCCREFADWTSRVIAAAASELPLTALGRLPRIRAVSPPGIVFPVRPFPDPLPPARVAPVVSV